LLALDADLVEHQVAGIAQQLLVVHGKKKPAEAGS
jgi:hypothetical protein